MSCDGRRSYLIEGETQSVVRKAQIVEPQKRLAIFVSSMGGGGAQRQMLNLAGGLAERGYNVDLVLARADGAFWRRCPSRCG